MTDLAEKYRPKTFEDVVNQDRIVASLKTVLSRGEGIPPAFLLTGPKGCGKTTIGEIIATYLGVDLNGLNYNYYNTGNTRGIDTIREIDKLCRFKPVGNCKKKYYLLDECHRITGIAQDALLALLERPPSFVHFCLCTTEPEKLLSTIRSRCSIYTVSSFPRVKLVGLLKDVCEKEQKPFSPRIYREIASVSEGSARNALKILDQVIDIQDEEEVINMILDASVSQVEIKEICRAMLDKSTDWTMISKSLKAIDSPPEEIRRAIINYLNVVCLNKKTVDKRLIGIINIMSDHNATMYSGMGGLVGLIGLCFESFN